MSDPIPVSVPDKAAFQAQYLRNSRDNRIYKVLEVGVAGVTVKEAEAFGGQVYGEEMCLTWRLVKAIYVLMVHAADIDTKGQDR